MNWREKSLWVSNKCRIWNQRKNQDLQPKKKKKQNPQPTISTKVNGAERRIPTSDVWLLCKYKTVAIRTAARGANIWRHNLKTSVVIVTPSRLQTKNGQDHRGVLCPLVKESPHLHNLPACTASGKDKKPRNPLFKDKSKAVKNPGGSREHWNKRWRILQNTEIFFCTISQSGEEKYFTLIIRKQFCNFLHIPGHIWLGNNTYFVGCNWPSDENKFYRRTTDEFCGQWFGRDTSLLSARRQSAFLLNSPFSLSCPYTSRLMTMLSSTQRSIRKQRIDQLAFQRSRDCFSHVHTR